MKKILVTGCNGQLGRAIRAEYAKEDVTFINTDVAEGDGVTALDIADVDAVLALVRAERPQVIINCAAHTNVDACETQWDAAYRINAIGPRNLAIAAAEVDAKLIHVSTDYVFAGNGTRPYTEFDELGPVSAYGKTKLEGERFVKAFARKYFIFRTAWLYGDGKNFAKAWYAISSVRRPVQWNLHVRFITMNQRRITDCSMQPARGIPTGRHLRRQCLRVQGRIPASDM